MEYVTNLERFEAGDFPMVCVRTGQPAATMAPIQAYDTSFGWFVLPELTKWVWGRLPFAEGVEQQIGAEYSKSVGVTLKNVHPDFVAAVREAQGKTPEP